MRAIEGYLPIPGGQLYWRRRGSGPLLLIVPGGAGDADASEHLVHRLADGFSVVTYDRRGFSRSTVLRSRAGLHSGIIGHSEDLSRLLSHLAEESVRVAAHSIGALIALDLVSRHADQVEVLVAHEPPVAQVLPEAERLLADQTQRTVEETFAREGARGATAVFTAMVKADPNNREPGVRLSRLSPRRVANLEHFLANDVPAARTHRLGVDALASVRTRLVFMVGRDSIGAWTRRCTEVLSARLGGELLEVPGDHNGFLLHPDGVGASLRAILSGNGGEAGRASTRPR